MCCHTSRGPSRGTANAGHLRGPATVSQHHVSGLLGQQAPEPPCQRHDLRCSDPSEGGQRHQAGLLATVEAWTESYQAVPVPKAIELVGQLHRHQLSPSAMAAGHQVEDAQGHGALGGRNARGSVVSLMTWWGRPSSQGPPEEHLQAFDLGLVVLVERPERRLVRMRVELAAPGAIEACHLLEHAPVEAGRKNALGGLDHGLLPPFE